ncbi:hypothetical protein RchiOBHm_Chr1g0343951 [Rosa chinensis]|uniref:Uncharacterized protein n=1 Tax=Rosa chinensis TaxID=74649 RepID=A0A2P6SEE6_ROSCH|nr:hypothetical protein RchiOBHm_Chr1g0343951 [Rosa chinensis]
MELLHLNQIFTLVTVMEGNWKRRRERLRRKRMFNLPSCLRPQIHTKKLLPHFNLLKSSNYIEGRQDVGSILLSRSMKPTLDRVYEINIV